MDIQQKIVELHDQGYCVLQAQLPKPLLENCREAFWPTLLDYVKIHRKSPNRGPCRHFLPMPFQHPCFDPRFFFDNDILAIVRGAMDDRVVADQWSCDVPLKGSDYQNFHADYQRPLFAEAPDLELPIYMLVVSFGLVPITRENGPIEIVAGSHRLPRKEALRAVEGSELEIQPILLDVGDVLIRHPWALHRGTPNKTDTLRALVSIRYVRRWYTDESRDVSTIPRGVWESLMPEERVAMRFPVAD